MPFKILKNILFKQYASNTNDYQYMSFSDEEYFEVIQKNEEVMKAYETIKGICKDLQKHTNCPEEDIDYFLKFIAGKWKN